MSLGKHRARPVVDGGWLDRRQAAARAYISVPLLDKFRHANNGPREARIGALVRFKPDWIDQWAEKFEVPR
jgi:hypothetical protein